METFPKLTLSTPELSSFPIHGLHKPPGCWVPPFSLKAGGNPLLSLKVAIVPWSCPPLRVWKDCVSEGRSLLFMWALRSGAKLRFYASERATVLRCEITPQQIRATCSPRISPSSQEHELRDWGIFSTEQTMYLMLLISYWISCTLTACASFSTLSLKTRCSTLANFLAPLIRHMMCLHVPTLYIYFFLFFYLFFF